MAKILFIGDIVGKGGRKALCEVLPQWRKEHQPDVVIANVENLAHGKGVTPSTLAELDLLGVDVYTGGNHIFKKLELSGNCFEKYPNLIRPANFEGNFPGFGYYRFAKKIHPHLTSPILSTMLETGKGEERDRGTSSQVPLPRGEGLGEGDVDQQFLIINLNGQVFMETQFDGKIGNPFLEADRILTEQSQKGDIIVLDFHSEATSEKIALGWYLDGRVSAVIGTHTHVPSADSRILPQGAAYISDVGMTGARDGVIGVKKQNVLDKFLNQTQKFKNEVEEEGVMQVNGVLIEISDEGKASSIEKIYKEI